MLSKRLKDRRTQLGLTQVELSRRCGFGDQQIMKYENEKGDPTLDHLYRLAQVLEVSTDYLLGLVDAPNQFVGSALSQFEIELVLAVRNREFDKLIDALAAIVSKNPQQPIITSFNPATK